MDSSSLMESLLLSRLNNLNTKLNTLFGDRYKDEQEKLYRSISTSSSGSNYYSLHPQIQQSVLLTPTPTITHYHYHEAPTPLIPLVSFLPVMQPPSQTIIINQGQNSLRTDDLPKSTYFVASDTNKQIQKKEDTEQKSDTAQKIVAGGGAVGLAGLATWVFANDEYVNYGLSHIENEFEYMSSIMPKDYILSPQLNEFKDSFNKWKSVYVQKTKPIFNGKVTCVTAGFVGLGGLFVGSALLMSGGVVGVTAGGCYLMWNYLTSKHLNENSEFYLMMTTLNNMISLLNSKKLYDSASAPPFMEPQDKQDVMLMANDIYNYSGQ